MEEKSLELPRQLISDLEGSPYPNVIDNELYTIWYGHVQAAAGKVLEF